MSQTETSKEIIEWKINVWSSFSLSLALSIEICADNLHQVNISIMDWHCRSSTVCKQANNVPTHYVMNEILFSVCFIYFTFSVFPASVGFSTNPRLISFVFFFSFVSSRIAFIELSKFFVRHIHISIFSTRHMLPLFYLFLAVFLKSDPLQLCSFISKKVCKLLYTRLKWNPHDSLMTAKKHRILWWMNSSFDRILAFRIGRSKVQICHRKQNIRSLHESNIRCNQTHESDS